MIEALYKLFFSFDQTLFELINKKIANPIFDFIMPNITNLNNNNGFKYVVLPIILALWFYKKRTTAIKVFIAISLLAALSDILTYRLLKSYVQRLRPNNDPRVEAVLRVPYGPQSGSFPSNHSVTGFALASTLSWYYPQYKIIYFIVASIIAFSRVYVGVHFVSDILAGALLGVFLAMLYQRFFLQKLTFFNPKD